MLIIFFSATSQSVVWGFSGHEEPRINSLRSYCPLSAEQMQRRQLLQKFPSQCPTSMSSLWPGRTASRCQRTGLYPCPIWLIHSLLLVPRWLGRGPVLVVNSYLYVRERDVDGCPFGTGMRHPNSLCKMSNAFQSLF